MSEVVEGQLLIDLIQHYPLLYDKSSKDFKDNNKKNNAWESIALAMSITVEEAQNVWKNLREKYSRVRKAKKQIASGAEAPEIEWPLYKYMGFMEKHILSRKRATNLSRPTSSCSSASSMCSTPLVSPTGVAPNMWSSANPIFTSEQPAEFSEDDSFEVEPQLQTSSAPKRFKSSNTLHKEIPSTSGTSRMSQSKLESGVVADSLGILTTYLKEKKKPDKNMAFGEYVGLTLMDMPIKEQNAKKLKIVEILNEDFDA